MRRERTTVQAACLRAATATPPTTSTRTPAPTATHVHGLVTGTVSSAGGAAGAVAGGVEGEDPLDLGAGARLRLGTWEIFTRLVAVP